MTTQNRRKREVQAREQVILAQARTLLLEHGYMGLTMDLVATASEYSKGLVYKHFTCKEDLLAALNIENHELRIRLFEKAAAFSGHPRERMTAIGIADETLLLAYPEFHHAEHVLNIGSINDKCSEERKRLLLDSHVRCMTCIQGIIRDALSLGDLEFSADSTFQQVAYGLWTMSVGATVLDQSGRPLDELGIEDPLNAKRHNQQILLDGYGWKPLSTDWDYAATRQRVREEVFADEYASAS